jgi:hypothetical protein
MVLIMLHETNGSNQCFENQVRNRLGRVTGSTGSTAGLTRFSIYYYFLIFSTGSTRVFTKILEKLNPTEFREPGRPGSLKTRRV